MARTVRNPLELRTPVRTISSVMRNAPNKRFRPTELDFGDGRSERGGRGGQGGMGGRGDRGGRGGMGVRGDQGGQDNFGNLTSVTRSPRETIAGSAPVSGNVPVFGGVTSPRGTTSGAPVSRVQTGTSRAPQASPKPPVTSTIKNSAVAAKPVTAAKPAATKTTTPLKPAATRIPIAAKTTTKAPVAAKTTKAPVAAKTTTTKPATTIAKPVVTSTKPVTKPTSSLTSTLKKAAVGAGTAALVNKAIDKLTTPKTPVVKPPTTPKTPVVKPPVIPGTPKPPIVKPPVSPVVKPPVTPKPPVVKPPVVKPPITSTVKPPVTTKPPAGGGKPPVVPKGSTASVTAALTDEQIQAELDRVRADEEAFVAPEGAVTNEDGTYSVTENGMVTTYDKDGNIVGMEAVTDTTVGGDGADTVVAGTGTDTTTGLTGDVVTTGVDTSTMTDLGEGYFADASGNIYSSSGDLLYTVGADGDYVDASAVGTSTVDETTYTDPVTGEVYNLGADGNWTLEGAVDEVTTYLDPDTGFTWNKGADGEWTQEGVVDEEEITTYSDPDTGFTWNKNADGEWEQEGFESIGDDTLVDDTLVDDTLVDDTLVDDTYVTDDEYVADDEYVDDSEIVGDAKGGSIVKKYKRNARRFLDGGLNSIYSDTDEEVQDFQNVDYNFGEFDDPTMSEYTLTDNRNPVGNTYLRSVLPEISEGQGTGLDFTPEGFPEGFVSNGDGTATYVDDDGSTMTIDADNNIVFTTDSDGNVFNPEVGESVSGTYPNERGESVSGDYLNERGESVSGDYLDERDESVSGNYPVEGITSSGSGNKPSFLAQQERDESVSGRYDQPDQSGVLDSLLNFVQENPGMAGGAIGALIASLMDQAEEGDSAGPSQPVDISELTSFDPRTTDFGAGMVGGRTGTGSPIVSYSDYAEDVGDEIIDDRLYSDLGISGYLREPDMNNYRDEEGNLTDQSGNLVDEYGYLLEDESEGMAEEEPAMAGGGTTHYTFGRVMNPAENLGLAEGMKKGGLSQAHTVHSHQTNPVVNNRVDFRKGSAVNGAGDGQSDDIPAWLADGEYVMDAELVSMLGNGSNKAGAKVLDKFRENIRAHKRGAPLGKIPPKAKSPLNYLKESMNG